MPEVRIGTSGWRYDAWKDDFYEGVPEGEWLAYCGERFTGLEVNATFYRLRERETFRKWRDAVPDDFRFAVKANRYLTHSKKLLDPDEPIRTERDRARALRPKLGAVLWQLPGNLHGDVPRLERFLDALSGEWPDAAHAVELRHRSWFTDEVAAALADADVAVCISDAADWPRWDRVTAGLVYVRLHGHTRTYASAYSGEHLDRWARRVQGWLADGRDVHVYFDNDAEGAAPHDALRLRERVEG